MASVRHLGLFPFCVVDASKRKTNSGNPIPLGDGTLYPLQIPISEAILWYWRIKKWKIEASITYQSGPNGAIETVSDDKTIISHADGFENVPLNEKFLVCPKETNLDTAGNLDSVQFVLFSLIVGAVGTNDPFTKERIFHNDETEFLKNVWPSLFIYASYFGGLYVSSIVVGNVNSESSKRGGLITIETRENLYTVDSYVPDTAEFVDGEIKITATEYWPYDPQDGLGPIYDKDTGAQLRPFPN
jgi:hypothetical protein